MRLQAEHFNFTRFLEKTDCAIVGISYSKIEKKARISI